MNKHIHRGSVTLLALIFGGIFFGVLTALAGYALTLDRGQDTIYQAAQARALAEAGLVHYRLQLIADPARLDPDSPSVDYRDADGTVIGTYELSISPDSACPDDGTYVIRSMGHPLDASDVAAAVSETYIPPGVAPLAPPDCLFPPASTTATSTEARFTDWRPR